MLRPVPFGAKSGLNVSPLLLGTMNFGVPGQGHQGDWTLGPEEAEPIFAKALELGVNYFDCANIYGIGACEEVVGGLLRKLAARDEYIFSTKVSFPMGRKPTQGGLNRKHIMESIDASLRRTGLDYVDQLIIHRHPHGIPGQPKLPIEETMEALHDVVKAGKAMYLGASSMFAWQFADLQSCARANGWTEFVSMQNHYNLIYREEEREMIPYCQQHGIAITPWSPLARGILSGNYQGSLDNGSTARSQGQDKQRTEMLYRGEMDFAIAQRVQEVAEKYGKHPAQIAVAWLSNKPYVTAPLVGVSKESQLESLADAVTLKLDAEDMSYLEELYKPLDNLLSLGTS